MHRGEVCEHAAKPTEVDVRLANAICMALHWLLSLLLRTNKEDGTAVLYCRTHKAVCSINAIKSLLKIDYVDAVSLTKDESLHLRVPTTRLVSKVDP